MKSLGTYNVDELKEMVRNRFYNSYLFSIGTFLLTHEKEVRMAELWHHTMDHTYSSLWFYMNILQKCGLVKTFKQGRDRKIVLTAEGKEFFKRLVEYVEFAKERLSVLAGKDE